MAHSVSPLAGQPGGSFQHAASRTRIEVTSAGDVLKHRVTTGDGLAADYPIAYTVGSGKVGFSYLVWLDRYLFQSPASFYTQGNQWDLTPGYESERQLDFTHPISEGCLFCHTGSQRLEPGTDNRFVTTDALTPIGCERCHGSAEQHLAKPGPGSIVNPARLAPAARDSVCEQCHLEGEVRILNPGRHWRDFQAGMRQESVFVTYLRTGAAPGQEKLKAVSQSEQLALSRCARESGGKLWCATCHDPHGDAAVDRKAEMRAICSSCHQQTLARAEHPKADECTSCHMPRLRPTNVAHSSISDHRIVNPKSPPGPRPEGALTAWREPASPWLAQRDLGLALVQDRRDTELPRAYDLLSGIVKGDHSDPEADAAMGSLLLGQRHPDLAATLFQRAVAASPQGHQYWYGLGLALRRTNRIAAAISALQRSRELDPSDPAPYRELAGIYGELGQEGQRVQVLRAYLQMMPQNLEFRRMLSK